MDRSTCFRNVGSDYPVTQRYFQEELNSQLEHCENFRIHIKLTHYYYVSASDHLTHKVLMSQNLRGSLCVRTYVCV